MYSGSRLVNWCLNYITELALTFEKSTVSDSTLTLYTVYIQYIGTVHLSVPVQLTTSRIILPNVLTMHDTFMNAYAM